MIDDVSDIADYYNGELDGERSRLTQHQLERDLTWRYLDECIPRQGAILEVGCGAGGYTVDLARRGYTIIAVDLSPVLVQECARRISDEGLQDRVQTLVADARDLGQVRDTDFDAVLIMGPLYHLIEEVDRKTALKEGFDRLRNGGVLFSSFISRLGIMGDLIQRMPEWAEDQVDVRWHLDKGRRPDHRPRGGFRGYFPRVSEIIPLHEAIGLQTLKLAGVEPCISADDESYNRLEGERRQRWLDLFYEISTEESIIGASRHILYVGRKP